jgi:hypothetical protein
MLGLSLALGATPTRDQEAGTPPTVYQIFAGGTLIGYQAAGTYFISNIVFGDFGGVTIGAISFPASANIPADSSKIASAIITSELGTCVGQDPQAALWGDLSSPIAGFTNTPGNRPLDAVQTATTSPATPVGGPANYTWDVTAQLQAIVDGTYTPGTTFMRFGWDNTLGPTTPDHYFLSASGSPTNHYINIAVSA